MDKKRQDCAESGLNSALCTCVSGNGCLDFDIKCMLTSTRSVMNKFVELQNYVDHYKLYIVAITESWCTDYISDAELQLLNYNLFRCDRKRATGGGVLLYVHASLHAVNCDDLLGLYIEDSVWCKVDLDRGEKLLIGVICDWLCEKGSYSLSGYPVLKLEVLLQWILSMLYRIAI